MRTRATWGALATVGILAALAHGSPSSASSAPELAVIVHPSNAASSLSAVEIESIFTSSRRHWPGGGSIAAFNYEPNDPLRVAFERAVLRMDPDEVSRFWIDQRIRGRAGPPRQVSSPRLMVRVVARLPQAIGYVPVQDLGTHGVKVVAHVRGGRVVEP
jgi:hypothetical protein